MSNPRNDQALLDRLCLDREAAVCPSWWGCDQRGCYEQAKENYADPKNRVVFGHVYQEFVFRDPFTGATVKEQIEK